MKFQPNGNKQTTHNGGGVASRFFVVASSIMLLVGCGETASLEQDPIVIDAGFDLADASESNDANRSDIADVAEVVFETPDWTEATHSNDVEPNFEEVFSDVEVKRLDFVITEQRWESMLDDMTETFGEFGTSMGMGGGLATPENDPIFVPAEVFYEGKQWYRVGIRFKGNSSLQSSWRSGILKMSFKIDFDEFEDEFPQIDNQRFMVLKSSALKTTTMTRRS